MRRPRSLQAPRFRVALHEATSGEGTRARSGGGDARVAATGPEAPFCCAAPSRPGFRLVGLGSLCPSRRLFPGETPATRLRYGAGDMTREPRGPFAALRARPPLLRSRGEPGPVPCALHVQPSGPFPRPVWGNRGSKFKSVTQGHTWRELEFEPKLPNSSRRDTRAWPSLYLTLPLPVASSPSYHPRLGSDFAAGDC